MLDIQSQNLLSIIVCIVCKDRYFDFELKLMMDLDILHRKGAILGLSLAAPEPGAPAASLYGAPVPPETSLYGTAPVAPEASLYGGAPDLLLHLKPVYMV